MSYNFLICLQTVVDKFESVVEQHFAVEIQFAFTIDFL